MGARPHPCRNIALRTQLLEGSDNDSSRNAELGSQIPRRRKPGSRRDPAVKDLAAQLLVEPARQRPVLKRRAKREVERAGRFGQRLSPPDWSEVFAETGSIQHTKLRLL
jgi:hypothetical protein